MTNNNLSSETLANDVLKTLLYFDVFKYPLNIEEISLYSHYSLLEVQQILDIFTERNIVFYKDGFYSILNNTALISRRLEGNNRAKNILKKARFISRFISQFPFVEAVFLSGSISKGYFGTKDDIDYFVVTTPGRMWVSRTLLIAFKKIFLLNSKKYFCLNYFISSNSLEIPEKNRFTATEFVTLKPMCGNGIHTRMRAQNNWVLEYFPHFINEKKDSLPIKKSYIKQFFEFLLRGYLGTQLDNYFMKITKRHQQKKFSRFNKTDFNIAFKGTKDTSKHHPDNNQSKVINRLNKKIEAFNKEHKLTITLEK